MREVCRFAHLDVEADEQLEFGKGVPQSVGVAHRDERVAARHEHRAHLPFAFGQDLVGQNSARERVVDRVELADAALVFADQHSGLLAERGEV